MKTRNRLGLGLVLAAIALSMGSHAADLPLGAGDVVKINVYNNSDLSLETRVSEAGTISYPLLGEVEVRGLEPAAASRKIAGMLEKGGYIRNAQVNMIVTLLQSQQVSVLGQVNRPGRYPIDGTRNVTDVLALAAGASADADDHVTLIRQNGGASTRQIIDLSELFRATGAPTNVQVLAGDIIYVERAPRFYIYGEVQRPGAYRLERNMSVMQALSVGGGLSARGTQRGLLVKRRDVDGQIKEVNVKLDDLLRSDDVVYVKESLF